MSEWISVDDRLPEEGTFVLMWCKRDIDEKFCMSIGRRMFEHWWIRGISIFVTYWMEFPDPPEIEK